MSDLLKEILVALGPIFPDEHTGLYIERDMLLMRDSNATIELQQPSFATHIVTGELMRRLKECKTYESMSIHHFTEWRVRYCGTGGFMDFTAPTLLEALWSAYREVADE